MNWATEVDKKLLDSTSKIEGSLKHINRRINNLETNKGKDDQNLRISKLEEIMEAIGVTFSSLKIKKKEVLAWKGPKFAYVPEVSEPKPNKINKHSSPVIIEKLPNELNIGETKILNPVFENDEVKESTKNSLSMASSSSKDILDDFNLEVDLDKTWVCPFS